MDQTIESHRASLGNSSGRPTMTTTATHVIAKLVSALCLMAVAFLFILVTIETIPRVGPAVRVSLALAESLARYGLNDRLSSL
jgi:hypothetical protein